MALFYVTIGVPIAVLADRANHRNILALRSQSLHRPKSALYGKAASMHENSKTQYLLTTKGSNGE